MCGIAGIINFLTKPNLDILQRMMDVIVHRGPDGAGTFTEGAIAFGHRRLAIIDRSEAGHQPMGYLNRYVITYNGEIYNHIELRKELESYGYQFKSHTDTEVIMAAYDKWGKDCLHRFNGMFALALYDRTTKEVFLARDRFGVKPFYYYIDSNGTFYFASEIKQFSTTKHWQATLNDQRAYDFLNWGITDHTEQTFFASVFQLRGGECFTINLNKNQLDYDSNKAIRPDRWYSLNKIPLSPHNSTEHFMSLFEDSVRLRLRADVAIGSCLSGGLDSSSIVCVANKLLRDADNHKNQQTFSACATVKEYDEREFIEEVVNATQTNAHYIYPDHTNLFQQLEQLIWHQDEPFGSTSIYAQWSVFQMARASGVTVMLDGQGADEQLAGYHGFFSKRYASLCKKLQFITLLQEITATKKIHGHSIQHSLQYLMNGLLPQKLKEQARLWIGKEMFTPNWLNLEKLGVKLVSPRLAEDRATNLREFSQAQLISTHLPMLLRLEDRNSMAHSIEARVPFLDYRLVEYIYSLPDELKLSGGITKRILRNAMQGILPEKIRMRMDKKGFLTPEIIWLRQNSKAFKEKLNKSVAASNGIIKQKAANQLFDDVVYRHKKNNSIIWRILCFGAWIEKFDVQIK